MPKVAIHIRVAVKSDFFALDNTPHYGTVYFLKNSAGNFELQPYYLTKDTDKKEFNQWFKNKQIYVFKRLFEPIEIIE
ncbi:hypothetical protein LXD69_10070 [Flavobacterium sediminilitoris]|uniref:Uncharacterized protein n=1 Tax=Flavobacterium sediminilitoris TaxID=2024526 RepID=A0ABY4HHT4_9FLAO|nr:MULTISPECIES: hypothetical protein [Flavobacterium]UOX32398.1 hypothetical protein LXD69_10070 [Flavobacterium sediminilitoris]